MIKRAPANGQVKVTFALPVDEIDQPVSVVGDFNQWDPYAHPLKKRSNGTRSASIQLAEGETVRFKYLTADGRWLTDPEADEVANDQYGTVDSQLVT